MQNENSFNSISIVWKNGKIKLRLYDLVEITYSHKNFSLFIRKFIDMYLWCIIKIDPPPQKKKNPT